MSHLRWTFPLAVLLSTLAAPAQLSPPVPKPIAGARYPALSPDGKKLAFVYREDIWLASSDGGRATPLTSHLEIDAYPIFSPDGNWLAFSSKRSGNWDVFIIPAEGGTPQQITWHAGGEIAFGWSPDSKRVTFSTKRDHPNYGIYAVDIASLRTELICEDYAPLRYPAFAPNGQSVVYTRNGMPWYRPRYAGSVAAQLWLHDIKTGKRQQLSSNNRQHLFPQFMPDGQNVLAVTTGEETPVNNQLDAKPQKLTDNPARTPNLWLFDLQGKAKQLTTFTGDSVRYPSVAAKSGDVAFEYADGIWILKRGSDKPAAVKLIVATDRKQNTRTNERLVRGVTEAEPSPDGKYMAFGLKGDIWLVITAKPEGVSTGRAEIAKQLTNWAGDDSDFSWAPDGKKIYFTSDREGNTRIYEMDILTQQVQPLWKRPEDVTHLRVSPDGEHLFFWMAGPDGGLHRLKLKDGTLKKLAAVPGTHTRGDGGVDYEWSPDGKWIAYTRRSGNGAYNIWIIPAEGGEAVNVTRLNAGHSNPAWSPDGKYLFFQSDRDGAGLYAMALKGEGFRKGDVDFKYEKPADPVKVEIDFTDITRRIRKISTQNPDGDITLTKDGAIYFTSERDIWRANFDGSDVKRVTTGGDKVAMRVLRDGQRATFIGNGEMFLLSLPGGPPLRISFVADWTHDVLAERQASFHQFWRSYHHGFYDAQFHGRDWVALRTKYQPLIESVDTADGFATLLQMMVGELEASHSEVSPALAIAPGMAQTPHLGFTLDYSHQGTGIKVKDVPENAPGAYEKTRIKPGEFILGIDGQTVNLDERLYEVLNKSNGRMLEMLVNTEPKRDGARIVRYKALGQEEWSQIHLRNQTAQLRKHVETKSGGKIGYLHIPAMDDPSQAQFEREAYEYIIGKEAMIFDVRSNGGGRISDSLIDMLERKQHGIYRGRDAAPEPAPGRAWAKPIVVVMHEHSFSNAEMFPYAIRQRGLGKLVGMPTPGYVIWTSSFTLTDGTRARLPGRGVWRMDGSNMENHGEKPDVQVDLTATDWLAGRDPQIDKAIEMLMPPAPQAGKN